MKNHSTNSGAWNDITRRQLLGTSAAGIASLSSLGWIDARADVPPSYAFGLPAIVDSHCHIFNIHDLPATDFAIHVFLRESGLLDDRALRAAANYIAENSYDSPTIIHDLAEPLVRFLEQELRAAAPTIDDDISTLLRMKSSGEVLKYTFSDESFVERDRALLVEILAGLVGHPTPRTPAPSLQPPEWISKVATEEAVRKRVEFAVKVVDALLVRDPEHEAVLREAAEFITTQHPDREAARSIARRVADGIFANDKFRMLLRWAFRLTRSRLDLMREMNALWGTDRNPLDGTSSAHIRLFTPSTVDYDHWVRGDNALVQNNQSTSPIPKQVEFLSLLSQVQPDGIFVHGMIGFDPLRQALDEARGLPATYDPATGAPCQAIGYVRHAIEQMGLIGVKLYPPMGFWPINNALLDSDDGTHKFFGETVATPWGSNLPKAALQLQSERRLGAALDGAMHTLFRYCAERDVAVMAHTSMTQGSFSLKFRREHAGRPAGLDLKAASRRAAPRFFEPLLDYVDANGSRPYTNLRINLAHFGGVWCLAAGASRGVNPFTGAPTEGQGFSTGFLAPLKLTIKHLESYCELPPLEGKRTLTSLNPQDGFLNQSFWSNQAIRLIGKTADGKTAYPNLYADIADWDDVVASFVQNPDKKTAAVGAANANTFSFFSFVMTPRRESPDIAPQLADRMLYGSDWVLLGKSVRERSYVESIQKHIRDRVAPSLGVTIERRIFGDNAINFYGLRPATASEQPKALERLQKFYRSAGKSSKFDALVAHLQPRQ